MQASAESRVLGRLYRGLGGVKLGISQFTAKCSSDPSGNSCCKQICNADFFTSWTLFVGMLKSRAHQYHSVCGDPQISANARLAP